MFCSSLRRCTASAAFKPTLAKNWLNSLVKTVTSFVKAGFCLSLEGMARLIIFQSEPELFLLAVISSKVWSLSASCSFFLTKSGGMFEIYPLGVLARLYELLQEDISRSHEILDFLVHKRARSTPKFNLFHGKQTNNCEIKCHIKVSYRNVK